MAKVVIAAEAWQRTREPHLRLDHATDAEIDAYDRACDALTDALKGER